MKTRGKDIGKYILSSTAISRERISVITQPRTFSESDLSSLSERANIIKSQGALPILQINHRGVIATKQLRLPPVAHSAKIAENYWK